MFPGQFSDPAPQQRSTAGHAQGAGLCLVIPVSSGGIRRKEIRTRPSEQTTHGWGKDQVENRKSIHFYIV